jgi:hypothetical protein
MVRAMARDPAGYSGTPLAAKLGIREGSRVAVLDGPPELPSLLAPIPGAVRMRCDLRGGADVVLAFATRRAPLVRRMPAMRRAIFPDGGLWVAWPKRTSGVPSELDESLVRELGLAAGLVDNKVCAISEVWSGLRLVYRRADRRRP